MDDDTAGETVELFETSRERQQYDDQASLYAIIVATEHLERAFATSPKCMFRQRPDIFLRNDCDFAMQKIAKLLGWDGELQQRRSRD